MKVLYFHQHFSTPKGTTGTRSYAMARHLIKRGHQVTMVCGSSRVCRTGLQGDPVQGLRRGTVEGIEVVEICVPYSNHDGLFKRAISFMRFALKSMRLALNEPADLIFATSTPLTAAIPGIAARLFRRRTPFVFEVRDLWPELPRAMGMRNPFLLGSMSLLEKWAYGAMAAGVALSPGIREGMKRRSPADTPIELVPNGCDLDLFQPVSETPSPGELPADFPTEGLRCVFTGAHGLANGLDAVLDAAAELKRRQRRDIQLIFIGDGKLKPHLLDRQRQEQLDNCIFIDPMPKEQLTTVMNQTDVGLMILADIPAFYYGTSPNKFFDYIASGLPVLNNYPGWLADMIQEHGCGLAVPPGRPDLFAEALEELADEPHRRAEMGASSRRLAEARFDREKLADKLVDFLETTRDRCAPVPAGGRRGR